LVELYFGLGPRRRVIALHDVQLRPTSCHKKHPQSFICFVANSFSISKKTSVRQSDL